MPEITLQTDVQFLKGVGPRFAKIFEKIGVFKVGDLLFQVPRRYEDRRNLPPIRNVVVGENVTVRGKIISVDARPISGGRVLLKIVLNDRTGSIALTWFNQPWIRKKLESYGGDVVAYGMVKEGRNGLELSNPEFEIIEDDEDAQEFARIIPVYNLTEGLPQKAMRRSVKYAVEQVVDQVQDPLPSDFLKKHGLMDLKSCLKQIHIPQDDKAPDLARNRLVFEEFLYLQIALAMRRSETHLEMGISFPIKELIEGTDFETLGKAQLPKSPASSHGKRKAKVEDIALSPDLFIEEKREKYGNELLWDQIHRILPFELTSAQSRVIKEIWSDMSIGHPMNRLVQGDVGSGKTAVAACAMLAAVRSHYQAALMAPTEILAEQHYLTFKRLFAPLGIEVSLLVGKQGVRERRAQMEQIATGNSMIVIGTHALIEEKVKFHRLGLVVVDEQHRFGVLQRAALRNKGVSIPDVLVMTATPIPRTLSLTTFGDLDVSIIDELPPGRKPIKTHWRYLAERPIVYDSVRKLVAEGRQAYFVCPLVSESELMLAQAAEELHFRLQTEVFTEFKVGLLHGKMKPADKELVMDQFRTNELNILVSTTVIEVGVDVPNASIMVIEDANRFGLAQLHQLRGRVGRGAHQSYCVLLADGSNSDASKRMEVIKGTTDGFAIAEADLAIRGPGNVAGTEQSGYVDFVFGDLVNDAELLLQARDAAQKIVIEDPTLSSPKWRQVLERVGERRSKMALVTIS